MGALSVKANDVAGHDGYERDAMAPPELLTVSEWADQWRVLPSSSAEAGQWRTDRTPYLRGIQDAWTDEWIQEITLVASTQMGKTESTLNCLGYSIDQDPGPTLVVKPTEDLAKDFCRTRIQGMIRESARLSDRLTDAAHDLTDKEVRLDRMRIYMGWPSPSRLAERAIRYLLMDEVDKYPLFSGREADPVKLAVERTRTYVATRKILKASTPTTRLGYIWRDWELSEQHQYHVPCGHCGRFFVMEFPMVRYPKDAGSDVVRRDRLAYLECPNCSARIVERERLGMIRAGRWLPEGAEITRAGAVRGLPLRRATHVGFRMNCLLSPWLTFSDAAAEFIASKDYPELLMNFVNSWLAEIWEDRRGGLGTMRLKTLRDAATRKRGEIPAEAQMMTAGVDWHGAKNGYYWSAWAWASRRRGWLVDYGQVFSTEDLAAAIWGREWKLEGASPFIVFGGVDSGWDTVNVYDWTRPLFPQVRPTKGEITIAGGIVSDSPVVYGDRTRRRKVIRNFSLLRINTTHIKDLLSAYVDTESEGAGVLHLCSDVDDVFLAHFAAEQKIRDRDGREKWLPRLGGIANHYLDTAVIATAIAERFGWSRLADRTEARKRSAEPRDRSDRDGGGGFRMPDGSPFLVTER